MKRQWTNFSPSEENLLYRIADEDEGQADTSSDTEEPGEQRSPTKGMFANAHLVDLDEAEQLLALP